MQLTTYFHLVLRMGLGGAVTARPLVPSRCAQRQYSPLVTLQTKTAKHVPRILTKAASNLTGTSSLKNSPLFPFCPHSPTYKCYILHQFEFICHVYCFIEFCMFRNVYAFPLGDECEYFLRLECSIFSVSLPLTVAHDHLILCRFGC